MTINADDILEAVTKVTKEWTRQRKKEERGRGQSREYIYSGRVDFTDVAGEILPAAYHHASGGGKYPVSKRQLYYACREKFRERTDREIEYGYFAGTLLVQFLNRNSFTSSWKVSADPRGTFEIPNAEHEISIPCGTLLIEQHLAEAAAGFDPLEINRELQTDWPSVAAGQRYQAVLFIEKKGFGPLLKAARILERFDLALISSEGQSVVAVRRLVDEVCAVGKGVPLFVVHDCDKAGFEISQRLTSVSGWAEDNDRVAYEFRNKINVTDLGLRLDDAQKYGLQDEQCDFKGSFAADSICTEAEKSFLRSGRRVELNSFTSPAFIAWMEEKLAKHLPQRLTPDDAILEKAFRRAWVLVQINRTNKARAEFAAKMAKDLPVPDDLRSQLAEQMADSGSAWDKALVEIVENQHEESKVYRPAGDA